MYQLLLGREKFYSSSPCVNSKYRSRFIPRIFKYLLKSQRGVIYYTSSFNDVFNYFSYSRTQLLLLQGNKKRWEIIKIK